MPRLASLKQIPLEQLPPQGLNLLITMANREQSCCTVQDCSRHTHSLASNCAEQRTQCTLPGVGHQKLLFWMHKHTTTRVTHSHAWSLLSAHIQNTAAPITSTTALQIWQPQLRTQPHMHGICTPQLSQLPHLLFHIRHTLRSQSCTAVLMHGRGKHTPCAACTATPCCGNSRKMHMV